MIYQNIYKEGFDVEKFIKKNQNVIDTMPLSKEDYAILEDRFTTKFDKNTKYTPEHCCICLGEFDEQEK